MLAIFFTKLLTRDVTSHWQADCTTDFVGDTSPPPPPDLKKAFDTDANKLIKN